MREGLQRSAPAAAEAWGEELVRLVADLADPGRHDRGLVLLEEGAVGPVSTSRGSFAATVHGSSGREHDVRVRVRALPREEAARLFRVLLHDPRLLAALLGSEGPAAGDGTAQPGAGSVLRPPPAARLADDDVEFLCSCPDPDPVCKHAVALALTVADLAERAPAAWLRARGVPLEGLSRGGRALVVVPDLPGADDTGGSSTGDRDTGDRDTGDPAEHFWDGPGGAPVLPPGLRHHPATDDRDPDLLAAVFRPLLRRRDPQEERERVAAAVGGLAAVYAALAALPAEDRPDALPDPHADAPRPDTSSPAARRSLSPAPAATAPRPAAATRPRRRPTAPRSR
ncbi:hypothetical protein GTR02_16510 [Kineococcus sp. R8]|uniref:hypothetical protein n=1 Tax=Kineococcus siccus TaxID=2696567 RepID=UPI0014135CD8|nr:hypothetical protein [Kineococcus siccus]NAZ83422.1 hypothetical protein [Kineococcus siccus]